jgi:chemotaxis protein methyltransferase CheR
MVQYRQLNLLQDFSTLGKFDVVFCRNVLIYFDQQTKTQIFERIARVTEPDGMLMLGAAESVVGITNAFRPFPDKRGLYQPSTGSARAPAALKVVAAR